MVWVWVALKDKRAGMAIQGIERMVAAYTEESRVVLCSKVTQRVMTHRFEKGHGGY